MVMSQRSWTTLLITLGGLVGCGGNPTAPLPSEDASSDVTADIPELDASQTDAPRTDASRADVAPRDVPDAGPARASAACMKDTECGGPLICDTDTPGGFCTAECTDDPSQTREQAQCGGRNTTCLSIGDGADSFSFCAQACNPTARPGAATACAAGRICTGWWYTHEGDEVTGCDFFCASDAQCAGERCNTRTGECNAAGFVMTRRADGEPCDPRLEDRDPPANQCRGICFIEGNNPGEGLCGSLLNLGVTQDCPDDPSHIFPIAPADENGATDNLGICIYRECMSDADCARPLRCVPGTNGDPPSCTYPSLAGDGGLPPVDASVRPDAGASPDASAADVPRG